MAAKVPKPLGYVPGAGFSTIEIGPLCDLEEKANEYRIRRADFVEAEAEPAVVRDQRIAAECQVSRLKDVEDASWLRPHRAEDASDEALTALLEFIEGSTGGFVVEVGS